MSVCVLRVARVCVCVVTYCLYKGAVVVTASSKSRGSVADVRRAMVDFISASRSLKILMFLSSSVCQREREIICLSLQHDHSLVVISYPVIRCVFVVLRHLPLAKIQTHVLWDPSAPTAHIIPL